VLLAALLTGLAVGCGDGDGNSGSAPKNVHLAAVIKGLDNPFFVTMREGLVTTARLHRAPIRVAAASAGLHDTAGQASALESLAADDADCYVVNPINQTNLLRALGHVPKSAPIVNIDSLVGKEAAKAVGVDITTYIGTDNVAGGRLAADAMAARVGRGAKVAVIEGIPGDASSGARSQGFKEGAGGRLDVVETVAADFERGKARLAARELLRADRDITGLFAVNDLMALGVADAVDAAGRRDEVSVVGFDGIRQALAAVQRGALSATVAQYPYSIGQLGVEACLAAVGGDSVPENVDAPVQVVTKRNVARARAAFPQPVEPFQSPFAVLPEDKRPRSAALADGGH
jgi:ABC-type sugar transport system substrate-binding protein